MKIQFALLQAILLTALLSRAKACPGFSVGETSCSSGVLTSSSLNAQCTDENTIYVSGTVEAGSDFDGSATVTLLPCVWGSGGNICFNSYKQDAGEICNLISNADGNDCGTAGSYTVDQTFDIPSEAQSISSFWNVFTIKILIGDEESCQQQADSSNGAFLMVGVGSLFAVSGLLYMRRRKGPLLVLHEEEVDLDNSPQHHFVEMKGLDVGCMA